METNGVVCALGLSILPLVVVGGTIYCALEVASSPITIPLYLYRTRTYKRWIHRWQLILTPAEQQLVQDYIDGPITLENLHKFASNIVELKPHKPHIPRCLTSPLHYMWNTKPSKEDFIASLNDMLAQIKYTY